MHAQSITPENSPTALVPPITPRAPWRVVQVKALDGYRLLVRFLDGTEGEVHMKELIHGSNAGVFACLADVETFQQVSLEFGAVTWPGDIDLAPDAMYKAIKSHGEWVLNTASPIFLITFPHRQAENLANAGYPSSRGAGPRYRTAQNVL